MKKSILILLICSLVLLASCQRQSSVTQVVEPTAAAALIVEIAAPTDAVPQTAETPKFDAAQLLYGTLKLQGTLQEINAAQASTLLPLWTNYQTLTANRIPGANPTGNSDQDQGNPVAEEGDMYSQDQIDELLIQIRAAMTVEQITAIEAMQINQESLQTLMEELGITEEAQFQPGNAAQPQGGGPNGGNGISADGSAPPDGGGNPPADGGTPPDGGGNAPFGAGEADQPADGGNGRSGQGGMLNPELLAALIDYLTQQSAQ